MRLKRISCRSLVVHNYLGIIPLNLIIADWGSDMQHIYNKDTRLEKSKLCDVKVNHIRYEKSALS